jgi:DNA processing protein
MLSHTLLHLSLIQNIGPVAIKKLVERVIEDSIDLYALTVSDFLHLGIPHDVATRLVEGLADQALFDREYELIEKAGVNWTTMLSSDYPALLWHTYAPPPVLYWQGEPVWNSGPILSVVGSRAGDAYGKRAVDTILTPCIQQGMIIVSGGARGIDTMAHELTLQQGGTTVVVVGTGLLRSYPVSNKDLFAQVAHEGGAVVSCFPLENEGAPWQFPVRNRIIAGMSRGCLVVQAAEGSGALITARLALNEGRNVYALPGHFDDPLSAGCHQILQEGAQLVTCAEVILRDYPGLKAPVSEQTSLLVSGSNKSQEAALKECKAKPVGKKTVRDNPVFKEKIETVETGLVALCARPISFDEIREKTGKSENELKVELFDLQLAGKLEQDFAGLWVKV